MKHIKTYEGLFDWFKKKKPKEPEYSTSIKYNGTNFYDKIIKDPYWRPNKIDNIYWKHFFGKDIELIMKFLYEEKIGHGGGEYYFDGIWKTPFHFEENFTYNMKQSSAKEGDKSKGFSFGRGQWFTLIERDIIVKATQEEIDFYDFHSEINKYNV